MTGPGVYIDIPVNQEGKDEYGEPMLIGLIDRKGLQKEPFSYWFQSEYDSYAVNTEVLAPVQGKLQDVDIEVFLGTWCSDSQREMPRFYKILDHLGAGEQRLNVIAVYDHGEMYKKSPQGEEAGKNIEFVPTFIFSRNGAELGRIIESPQVSLEADMAAILAR